MRVRGCPRLFPVSCCARGWARCRCGAANCAAAGVTSDSATRSASEVTSVGAALAEVTSVGAALASVGAALAAAPRVACGVLSPRLRNPSAFTQTR